jgi:hypothetical protein
LLNLTEDDKVFNVGKSNKNEKKPDVHRLARSGLQKEGPRVIFGVPKPGKNTKFMEVSKHYVADGTSRINEGGNGSLKFANSSIPHASGSRSWKDSSIHDAKEKPRADFKPTSKPGRPQNVLGRVIPSKQKPSSNFPTNDLTSRRERTKDTSSHFNSASQRENQMERASYSETTGAGPTSYSSRASSTESYPTKKPPTARVSKGKPAPAGGRLGMVEKASNGNPVKSTSEEVLEPRRSNRKIQPTSRVRICLLLTEINCSRFCIRFFFSFQLHQIFFSFQNYKSVKKFMLDNLAICFKPDVVDSGSSVIGRNTELFNYHKDSISFT